MENRIVGSFAHIKKGDQLLMVLRKFPPYANYWSWPGGAVNKDETLQKAVIREVKEETNLSILVRKYLGNVSFVGDHDLSKHYRAEVHNCTVLKVEIKTSEELYDAKWINKDKILSLKLAKPAEEFYKALLSTTHIPISVFLG